MYSHGTVHRVLLERFSFLTTTRVWIAYPRDGAHQGGTYRGATTRVASAACLTPIYAHRVEITEEGSSRWLTGPAESAAEGGLLGQTPSVRSAAPTVTRVMGPQLDVRRVERARTCLVTIRLARCVVMDTISTIGSSVECAMLIVERVSTSPTSVLRAARGCTFL